MLACGKTVTLVRHVDEMDGDSYTMEIIRGVGYTEETKIQQDGKGIISADICTVTIPQDATAATPIKDDHVALGELSAPPKSIAELKRCGLHVYRVTSVNDYRGGILGHWELIGS